MHKTYVFVDYENVQPEGITLLQREQAYHVRVFIGATQKSVSFEKLVIPIREMGERGDYIPVSRTGPNALDFHIAFTLGQIAERERDVCFRIISKDKGFDPLVDHLKGLDRDVARHESIHAMLGLQEPPCKIAVTSPVKKTTTPVSKPKGKAAKPATKAKPKAPLRKPPAESTAAQMCMVYLSVLKKPKATRPGTLQKLQHDIRSKNPSAPEKVCEEAIALLKNQRLIEVDASGKVTYTFVQNIPKTEKETAFDLCKAVLAKFDKKKNPKMTLPKTLARLKSLIRSTFTKQKLTDPDIDAMIAAMRDKKRFTVKTGDKIEW